MTWLKRFIPIVASIIPCLALAKGSPEQKGIYDFSKGLDSYHSSLSLPDGFVQSSDNVLFDAKAPVEKRQGYTASWSVGLSSAVVINSGNDFVYWYENSSNNTLRRATITNGAYTVAGVAAAVAAAMNTVTPANSWTGGVSTGNVSITGSNGWTFSNDHNVDPINNVGTTIGFPLGNSAGFATVPLVASSPPVFSLVGPSFTGLWTYTDQTNTTWQIVRASTAIYANNLSGSVAVLVATVSANNLVGESNAFGFAYFVDQSQGVYYWNGSSVTFVSGSPLGSIITQFHNRLWVTGAAPPNGNQLYGSSLYNGTLWTPNINPNDPVQLTVGIQDNFDNITAEYVYLDTLYEMKHYGIFALYGFDQTNFQISQITQECGCIDGNTIQTFGGDLKFVSLRGVEDFNGYTCNRISDPVKDKVDPAIQVGGFTGSSWVQSQTADWLSGTIVQLDTTDFSPAIALVNQSTVIVNNSFETGDFTGWTAQSDWTNVSSHVGTECNQTAYNGTFFAMATTNTNGTTGSSVSVVLASNTSVILSSAAITENFFCNFGWQQQTLTGIPFGLSVDLIFTDASGQKLTSNSFVANGSNIVFYTTVDSNPGPIYYQYIDFINPSISFATNYTSGTFKSQIDNVGPVSAWGNFSVGQQLDGGSIAFSICSSTNSNMSAPNSCGVQIANSQITIGTGTYVQWSATFTVTVATQAPTLNSATVNWFTGKKSVPMASTVWDNRYWLSLTTNTADTGNDAILVLSKSGAWSDFDIHAGGLTQYKGSLYHSDSLASGNVYLDNQGYMDNGTPINAFVLTKDYPLVNLAQDAVVQAVYPTFSDQSNANVSLSYFVDRNPTAFDLSSVNQSEYLNASSIKLPLGSGETNNQVFGETFSFLIGQNDANPMQFFGLRALFNPREIQ